MIPLSCLWFLFASMTCIPFLFPPVKFFAPVISICDAYDSYDGGIVFYWRCAHVLFMNDYIPYAWLCAMMSRCLISVSIVRSAKKLIFSYPDVKFMNWISTHLVDLPGPQIACEATRTKEHPWNLLDQNISKIEMLRRYRRNWKALCKSM